MREIILLGLICILLSGCVSYNPDTDICTNINYTLSAPYGFGHPDDWACTPDKDKNRQVYMECGQCLEWVYAPENASRLKAEIEKGEWLEYFCEREKPTLVSRTDFDLFDYYNLTCRKIEIIIMQWQPDWNQYYVDYDTGDFKVKGIGLVAARETYKRSAKCGSDLPYNNSPILYGKQNLIDYYAEKCEDE